MQVYHKGAQKASLDPIKLRDKEGDRSSLEPLSFGFASGTPNYPAWIQIRSGSNASAS